MMADNVISEPVVVTALLLAPGVFARPAAIRAADRLILEAFFFVKSLFTFGKREFCTAILAYKCLVWHGLYLLKISDKE